MQPTPNPTPVPTSQRPLNGFISGAAAQLVGNMATGYMIASGLDPASAATLGTVAGSIVSGIFATIGDLARGALEQPSVPWWAKTLLQVPARIG